MRQKTDYLVKGVDVAFNIDVYEKNRNLYVRFDILSNREDNTNILKLKNLELLATESSQEPLKWADLKQDKKEIMDKDILKHLLDIQNKKTNGKDPLAYGFYERTKPGKFCSHIQITYKLSVIPHILINWLTYLAIFINKNLYLHFQFGDHTAFKNMDKHTDINALVSGKRTSSVIRELMARIVAFKSFEPKLKRYKNALADLEKLYLDYCEGRKLADPKTLIQCVSDQNRCTILYDKQFKKIADSKDLQHQTSTIVSLATSMLSKRHECLFMFELINTRNKLLFIEPCLEKVAPDGKVYSMNHTELSLIYFAEFAYLPDGRIAIVNLDKNPTFIEYYAKGKPNFDIFHDELYYWAKCLGLEIEPGCNFHTDNAIIFKLFCTPIIENRGLHLNSRYCEILFNVYNTWAFYTRIAMADNNFNKLPKETLDQIILEANPSFKRICNLHNPGFFHAIEMGRDRGQKEHAEVVEREVRMGALGC